MKPRSCDGCTACCTIYTIVEMQKPCHNPCQHICAQGCAIHDQPRPPICTDFQCDWTTHGDWNEELRPDKCGIIYLSQLLILPNEPYKFITGTMANPYAHLRTENRKHIEHLSRAGHVLLMTYGVSQEQERYTRFDHARWPALTEMDLLKGLKHLHGDKIRKNMRLYRKRDGK